MKFDSRLYIDSVRNTGGRRKPNGRRRTWTQVLSVTKEFSWSILITSTSFHTEILKIYTIKSLRKHSLCLTLNLQDG